MPMANKLVIVPLLLLYFFISVAECKWDIIVIVLHSVTFPCFGQGLAVLTTEV